ncbi:MAG: DUF3782 domain-containing protein [Magnetococcales bacterium]|nr:DUF3782 domain-containing protein [Magnetococcales bacterium]
MNGTTTVDEIWAVLRETALRQKETEKLVQETAQQMKETDRQMRETDQRLGVRMQETFQQMQETDRKFKEVSTLVGNLGSRWGDFVEKLVAPACIAMFTKRGIQVDEVFTRAKKTVAGQNMEIDILVANTIDAVLVEVKSNLTVEDVRNHLERLKRFKSFFNRYADCTVYGAVAGIAIDAGADQFAINQGLFVIVQSGDSVQIANDKDFKARTW